MDPSQDEPWKDKERMFELYYEEDYTFAELASLFGCAESTINRWMKQHRADDILEDLEIEIPDSEGYKDSELMKRLYIEEELSTIETSTILNCSSSTVRKYLFKHGIDTRDRAEGVSIASGGQKEMYFYTSKAEGHEIIKPNRDTYVIHHRLLAVAKYGLDALDGMQVHHRNGNCWDNRFENIELLSPSHHALEHNGNFTWLDKLRAVEMYEECNSSYKVADVIGCSASSVQDWVNNLEEIAEKTAPQ